MAHFYLSEQSVGTQFNAVSSARLVACSIWLLLHRMLLSRGFLLRRRGLSTDTVTSLCIGITSTAWMFVVLQEEYAILKNLSLDRRPDEIKWTLLVGLSRLAQGPVLVQILFGFWILSYIDGQRAERTRSKPLLWSLSNLKGPFEWESGIHHGFYQIIILAISISVGVTAAATLLVGDAINGTLRLVGLLAFIMDGVPRNPYVAASHRYSSDRLRIVLPTSHHEGTLYVLPSDGIGIDAIWSPKIKDEHSAADGQMMVLFQHMRSTRWVVSEPLESLRKTLAIFHEKALLTTIEVELLASWIYVDKETDKPKLRTIECDRAPNIHLIGRDLIYALCHAEYIVFMGQGRLPQATRAKLGSLRLLSRSGEGSSVERPGGTIGFRKGFEGYKEAVDHVYAIFDLPVDAAALDFSGTSPPAYSPALSMTPSSIDDYVSKLWTFSIEHGESTFTAMYIFTTVWFMELGNCNGFHIFPLRCKSRSGDLVSQQIAWRQAWFSGCIAELISASPALFGAYVAGYFK